MDFYVRLNNGQVCTMHGDHARCKFCVWLLQASICTPVVINAPVTLSVPNTKD